MSHKPLSLVWSVFDFACGPLRLILANITAFMNVFYFCLLEVIEVLTFLCTNSICLFRIEKEHNLFGVHFIISGMAAALVLLKFNLIFEIFGMNLRDIYEIYTCCASLKTSVAFAYLWKYGNTKVHSSDV